MNKNQDSQNQQTDSQSAKLAVIAGAITTFGDALANIAAVLAIEEERQEHAFLSISRDAFYMDICTYGPNATLKWNVFSFPLFNL
ncbi:hypothetical protein [Lysinibacillus agricola]|uniref:hypothetical protein n=1 Tax=Lysinibacillus agricola TaxID=2590012 RepID=UPI003C219661